MSLRFESAWMSVLGTPHRPKPGAKTFRVSSASRRQERRLHTSAQQDITALYILDSFSSAIIDFMALWWGSDRCVESSLGERRLDMS